MSVALSDGGEAIESPAPAYHVRGDDPSVLAQAVRALIARLVGDREPALVVEEHGGPGSDELDVAAVVDALTTPPFLIDRRVVVLRDAGKLASSDGARVAAALEQAAPSTVLVVAAGGGTIPQPLLKALKNRAQIVDAAVGTGRDRSRWLAEHVHGGPVHLSGGAVTLLERHLGDDVGRLEGMLDTLGATYGAGATVDEEALRPFLGEAGGVPPWDLTDAIDRGQTDASLVALRRMQGPGGRSPLEILGHLHRHFDQMLRLDGTETRSPEEAAGLLGVRSAFVAKKALAQGRSLGSERIAQAVGLLARADLDLKGESALPDETVLQVLVARLSRLAPASARRRAG